LSVYSIVPIIIGIVVTVFHTMIWGGAAWLAGKYVTDEHDIEASSSSSQTEKIYGADGVQVTGSGSILWDSKGNALHECYDGTYKSSDGTHYRKNHVSDGVSQLEKVNW
jgi:hypothetical protein